MKTAILILCYSLILTAKTQQQSGTSRDNTQQLLFKARVQSQQEEFANSQTQTQTKLQASQTQRILSPQYQSNYFQTIQPQTKQNSQTKRFQASQYQIQQPQYAQSQTNQVQALFMRQSQPNQSPRQQVGNNSQTNFQNWKATTRFQTNQSKMTILPKINSFVTQPRQNASSTKTNSKGNPSQASQPIKTQPQINKNKTSRMTAPKPQTNKTQTQAIATSFQTHPLRMTAVIDKSLKSNPNLGLIQNAFGVAAAYFKRVLKVNPVPQEHTRYDQINCGDIFPQIYKTYGFNQKVTDMVILLKVKNFNISSSASGSYCVFRRRVTYGVISYNESLLAKSNPETNSFDWIQITIHEMFHILGFSTSLYSKYHMSPTNDFVRPIQGTIRCFREKCYIITPKVTEYMRTYFNCKDAFGAPLQRDQSHWDSLVFYQDLMASNSGWYTNRIITVINLLLLEDTGFYIQVDTTQSIPTFFGSRQECWFAQGYESISNVIRPCDHQCDISSRYGMECSNNSNPVADLQCSNPSLTSKNGLSYYGKNSRCFKKDTKSAIDPYTLVCLKASCIGNKVVINVNNQTLQCSSFINRKSLYDGTTIFCPSDIQRFCDYEKCIKDNECQKGKGLCLNGKCLYAE